MISQMGRKFFVRYITMNLCQESAREEEEEEQKKEDEEEKEDYKGRTDSNNPTRANEAVRVATTNMITCTAK